MSRPQGKMLRLRAASVGSAARVSYLAFFRRRWTDACHEFLRARPTELIKLDRLHLALGGPLARVQQEQLRRDQREVDLERDPARALCQPMPAAEDAFEPTEEQFHLPAMLVGLREHFRWRHLGSQRGGEQDRFV